MFGAGRCNVQKIAALRRENEEAALVFHGCASRPHAHAHGSATGLGVAPGSAKIMHAGGGNGGVEALLKRLRTEIEKRKRGGSEGAETYHSPAFPAPTLALSREEMVQLQYARSLIRRALTKTEVSSTWPRLLRRLRRNQGAVNKSLAEALGALADMMESMQRKFLSIDERIAKSPCRELDGRRLRTEWEETSREWERRIASWEDALIELEGQVTIQRKQIDELTRGSGSIDA